MSPLTPSEKSQRGRIGGFKVHALYDSTELTAPARAASPAGIDWHLNHVPAEITDPAERLKRAEHLRKAYFATLAFKSARACRRSS